MKKLFLLWTWGVIGNSFISKKTVKKTKKVVHKPPIEQSSKNTTTMVYEGPKVVINAPQKHGKMMGFFKALWSLIKNFFMKIKTLILKIFTRKKVSQDNITKERVLVKIITASKVQGKLINKTHEINGYLLSAKREAIAIPQRMENLKINYVLPEDISFVKKNTILVEFDVASLEIQYKYNQEQIASLKEIKEKEDALLASGGVSKKETLDIESRLNKVMSEQEMLEEQINNKILRAPFDGYVLRPEKNEIGQNARIKRGDLLVIHDCKNLLMEGYISAGIYNDVFVNDEVTVTVFQDIPQILSGKIKNKEQFSEQNTGLFKVLIHIPLETTHNLMGQPAQAILKTKQTIYLTKVPEKAVFFDKGQMAVFMIIDNQAVRRVVNVEKAQDDWLFVSGLPQECTIITDEANVINNGDLVQENKIKTP
jgi:multidrug efflux system membrane fusion protein